MYLRGDKLLGLIREVADLLVVLSTLIINILILHKHCLTRSVIEKNWSWRLGETGGS